MRFCSVPSNKPKTAFTTLGVAFALLALLCPGPASHATNPPPAPCPRALTQVDEVVLDIEMIVEEILLPARPAFDAAIFLAAFSLPPEYAASEAEFQIARARASAEYRPLIEALIKDLHRDETIQAKLRRLAHAWDSETDELRKDLILAAVMKMFKVAIEDEYMLLIARADCSPEFKAKLGRKLRELFRNDQAWIAPLDRALRAGGASN